MNTRRRSAPRLPYMVRPLLRLELISTVCFAVLIAVIEGGIISVFTKKTFASIAPKSYLNLFVAFLGATPEIANILSFLWSWLGQGRRKIPLINTLQLVVITAVAAIAMVPTTYSGLIALAILAFVARTCWSGMITIRPTVWRANYDSATRARAVARLSTAQMLVAATLGICLGTLLDIDPDYYHLLVPASAAFGLVAVWATHKLRVRHERRLLASEKLDSAALSPLQAASVVVRVLRADRWYRRFMNCMFLLGLGNLMLPPILVIILAEEFGAGYLHSILVTTAIPALITPLAIPMWSRMLDRAHVVRFRTIQSWTFVVASLIMAVAAYFHLRDLLFVSAALQGVGFAGGALAWNLGHVDFAPPSQTSQYMATHVTLNGVRGLIAPFSSVFLYQAAKATSLPNPGVLVLLLASAIAALGALGFARLHVDMGPLAQRVNRKV